MNSGYLIQNLLEPVDFTVPKLILNKELNLKNLKD